MNIRFFNKNILPLIVAAIAATIFFVSYNQYILDKSLTNLKVSLRQLEGVKNVKDAHRIKDVLEGALILEITREDIDPSSLAKIEFAGNIIGSADNKDQLRDANFFLRDVVRRKEEKSNWFSKAFNNLFLSIFPQKRTENTSYLKKQIERLKREVAVGAAGVNAQQKYLEISRLCIRAKSFQDAKEFLIKTIEIDPDTQLALKAQLYLGFVYKFQGKLSEAREVFAKAKENLPQELGRLSAYQEGDCLYAMGKEEDAARTFEILFERDPSSPMAQLSQFRAGYIALYDLDDQQKAYDDFMKLETASITTGQERIREMGGRNVRRSMEPGGLFSYSSLNVHLKTNVVPSIAKQFREAGFKLLAEGYRLSRHDKKEEGALKYRESLDKFALALKFYSSDAFAHSGRGLAFYFLDNKEEAIANARRAHQLVPESPEILANLAFIYYHLGLMDEAVREYAKATMLAPRSAFLHYNLGTLYVIKSDLIKAIDHLRKAAEYNPHFVYSYNNLGYLLWLKGAYAEAKVNLEKAISIKPDYVEAHYNLAILFLTLKDYARAREEFMIVEQLLPSYQRTSEFLNQIGEKFKY